jgi:hypothetical protein
VIAEGYGRSRSPTRNAPTYIHRWEGECAASENIAAAIREAKDRTS